MHTVPVLDAATSARAGGSRPAPRARRAMVSAADPVGGTRGRLRRPLAQDLRRLPGGAQHRYRWAALQDGARRQLEVLCTGSEYRFRGACRRPEGVFGEELMRWELVWGRVWAICIGGGSGGRRGGPNQCRSETCSELRARGLDPDQHRCHGRVFLRGGPRAQTSVFFRQSIMRSQPSFTDAAGVSPASSRMHRGCDSWHQGAVSVRALRALS